MSLPKFNEWGELHLTGFPICPGIAIGKPFFFLSPEEKIPEFIVSEDEVEKEIERYYKALSNSKDDLITLQKRLKKEGGNEAAAILSTHLEIMSDPLMTVHVEQKIREKKKNTEYVFKTVVREYERRLSDITDLFFRERLKDFQDISRRIIAHLRNKTRSSLRSISNNSIIFAHELSPSDTAEANTDQIEAFVTRSGAETSHVAIMARAKGIPFVANVNFPDFSLSLPPFVIVDGNAGIVIVNPSKESLERFRKEQKKINVRFNELSKINLFESQTLDGKKVRLSANVEMFNELDIMKQYGGGRIGLFRTEYLFLSRNSFPSEEEQFKIYKNMVEKMGGHSLVIRVFDIGGDKLAQFHLSRYEKNPNLGCRAIRLLLKEKKIFKTQVRAILRASAFGDVNILFPLISGLEELIEAKKMVQEAKDELKEENIPFARKIAIGSMIEVPSAALIADLLAKECDFLSIGTNDLVQYCLAVDRGNPAMSYLYNPAHPSVLRLIKQVIEKCKQATIPVSICGEMAGDPKFIPLLLGLGIEEFSLSLPAIPVIKDLILKIDLSDAIEFADHIMTLTTADEIQKALFEFSKRKQY